MGAIMKKMNHKLIYELLTLLMLLLVKFIFLTTSHPILNGMFLALSLCLMGVVGLKMILSVYKQKDFQWKNLLLFSYVLVFDLLFYIKNELPLSRAYLFSILLIASIILLISMCLSGKWKILFDYIVIIFYAIYFIGQDLYYRIFNDFFSFKEAGTLKEGLESSESMYQLEFLHVLMVIMLVFTLLLYHKEPILIGIKKTSWKSIIYFPVFLVALIIINIDAKSEDERPYTSDYYLYQSVFHRESFVSRFGLAHLMSRDFIDWIIPPYVSVNEREWLEEYLNRPSTHQLNAKSGIFEGKNLVFILAETYDELALSEVLTPNLYRLKSEGLSFENHYTPVFQRTTSDTEFIFNTGLIPSIEDGPTSSIYGQNSYSTSLAYLLSQKGYLTQAFHGNYKTFYQRDLVYRGYGYESFFGQDELSLLESEKRFDTIFYGKAKDLILPDYSPFLSFIITFSGHSPYTSNHPVASLHYEEVNAYFGTNLPEEIKYYIATQIELDHMIGMLFDDLMMKGLLQNTVIVLSGDHYPYTMNQSLYEAHTGKTKLYEKQKGNLYIWSYNLVPEQIQTLSSSFDILPTLINMFQLDANDRHYVGQDIFGETKTNVYYKNYSYFNGDEHLFLSDRRLSKFDYPFIEVQDKYLFSRLILRLNEFKIN